MYSIGQRISYRSEGKVSRLEGKHGKIVTGVVIRIGGEFSLTVMPDHRTEPGAAFPNLAAAIDVAAIVKPKKVKA